MHDRHWLKQAYCLPVAQMQHNLLPFYDLVKPKKFQTISINNILKVTAFTKKEKTTKVISDLGELSTKAML